VWWHRSEAEADGPTAAMGRWWSQDQGLLEVRGGLGADVLDAVAPATAEVVVAEAVLARVDLVLQAELQAGPLLRVDVALEDGALDALAEVEACLGDAAEAAPALGGGGGDVVADDNEHGGSSSVPGRAGCGSAPQKGRVGIQVAAEVPGQKARLEVDDHAEGCLLVEKGMGQLVLLALLKGDQDLLSGVVVHQNGSGLGGHEAFGPDGAGVDQ